MLTAPAGFIAAALAFLCAAPPPALAAAVSADASVAGRVASASGPVAPGTRVVLAPAGDGPPVVLDVDASGSFAAAGLRAGAWAVSLRDARGGVSPSTTIHPEPGDLIALAWRMGRGSDARTARLERVSLGQAGWTLKTDIPASQVATFPSGNSVWSILENQDLSATMDRVDVGGLWSSEPALFSARGSASWTQTVYRLNGLDVTDPYDGGTPLVLPDVWSLDGMSLANGSLPASDGTPGGTLDLAARTGGRSHHGALVAYGIPPGFTASNVTPSLAGEGITEAHRFRSYGEAHAGASGPVGPRARYTASFTARDWSRDVAMFSPDDKASLLSGVAGVGLGGEAASLDLLWTGQKVSRPSYGAWRNVPFSATLDRDDRYDAYQAFGRVRLSPRTYLEAGAGYARRDASSAFQTGSDGPGAVDLLTGAASGSAAPAGRLRRGRFSAFVNGRSLAVSDGGLVAAFDYGLRVSASSAATRRDVRGGVQLRTWNGLPEQVAVYRAPDAEEEEKGSDGAAFVDATVRFPGGVAARLGLRADTVSGHAARPADAVGISWFNLSPRLGLRVPVSPSGNGALRFTAARYFYSLPLSWLAYGNADAAGALVYAWTDPNGDGRYQPGEEGTLLRREGPFFGAVDPGLKRPYTDELTLGFTRRSLSGWSIDVTGFLRRTRNLAAAVDTGVPFDTYEPSTVRDPGDDMKWGTWDDLDFTVFGRDPATFGRDAFTLMTPTTPARRSHYEGLDVTVARRLRSGVVFFLSFTAMQITGWANPGNRAAENDEGYVGSLFADPNTLINAEGRLRFDRAYTGRIGLAVPLPGRFRASMLVKYWDGQPFARKIAVTGLPQGPFYIMAHPRGVSRYEFNMTLDLRLEKAFPLGAGRLRVMADGFNVPNFHLATAENEWTSPVYPLRYATEIESPAVLRVGVAYEF